MYYYIYVLESQDDKSLYIGMTTDLERRIKEHQSGIGGRTTKHKGNWRLIYFEGYRNKEDVVGREKFLKGGSGRNYIKRQLRYYLEDK